MKANNLYYVNDVKRVPLANGIYCRNGGAAMKFAQGIRQETIYVRCSDFQRARALIAENFKDNPKVMKGLAPETPFDN